MRHWLRRIFYFYNDGRVKLRNRPDYSYRVLVAAAAVMVLCLVVPALRTREWVFGLLGVVAGVGYFLFQQHLNETKFFAELFEKFNARYNAMHGRLQQLRKSTGEFTDDQRLLVADYFNLCAEEFLFYDARYIDERVWQAWKAGMKHYTADARFLRVWTEDGGAVSYYGFIPPTQQD